MLADPDELDYGLSYEVIVSEDQASGEIEKLIKEQYPWVRWFEGPGKGPAANRNFGAKQARFGWIAFTDDDCLPQENWLESFLNNTYRARVLEGETQAERERYRLDIESPINESGGYLWSCNFAIEKTLFHELSGFDECFPFAALEDVDFHTRLKKSNIPTVFIPQAKVIHPWRQIKDTSIFEKRRMSLIYYWNKHPDEKPESLRSYYWNFFIQSLLKNTLPGLIKYRFKGWRFALYKDFFTFKSVLFPKNEK